MIRVVSALFALLLPLPAVKAPEAPKDALKVEGTPKTIRLRKKILRANQR